MLGWLRRKREERARAKLMEVLDEAGLPSFPVVVMRASRRIRVLVIGRGGACVRACVTPKPCTAAEHRTQLNAEHR